MKRLLNEYISKRTRKRGNRIIPHTPIEEVNAFINKLHPYNADKKLIRLGDYGDGGYLVPDDLAGIEACLSPGVDDISDFEFDCHKRGMKIYLADKSVDKPNINLPESEYQFLKKFIGCTNNEDFITMDTWVDSINLAPTADLLLQMDIEGAEYHSIINMSDDLLRRFRVMIIEFHHLNGLWDFHFMHQASVVFDKLLQSHTCVHIHPNNYNEMCTEFDIPIPSVAEFTFLRNDRITSKVKATQFPHPLDRDNTDKEHITLPDNWFFHENV